MKLPRCPNGTRRNPKTKTCVANNKTRSKRMSITKEDNQNKKQHKEDLKALEKHLKFLQKERKKNKELTAKIRQYIEYHSKTDKEVKQINKKIEECNKKLKLNMAKITEHTQSFDHDIYDRLDDSEVEELLEKYEGDVRH